MDRCTSAVPDHEPQNAADTPSRAPQGFYRADQAVYYVTADGRPYLLRARGEPSCLRACRGLPEDAAPYIFTRDASLELLAETAERLAIGLSTRLLAIREEVSRDAAIVGGALLQQLLMLVHDELGGALLDGRTPDTDVLHDRLAEVLERSRKADRRLRAERANRRGERPNLPAPREPVPLAVLPFLHRGEYAGAFTGMEAAGQALASRLRPSTSPASRIRDAHLRGDLWTVPRARLLYVFTCSPEGAG